MAYGCVPYSSNFSCESLKGSGRSCTTVTDNLNYAINGGEQNPEVSNETTISEENVSDNLTIQIKKCDNTNENCIVVDEKNIDVTVKKENASNINILNSLSETLNKFNVGINSPTGKPIVTQPKIVKVTILPYVDSKERLNMSKDVYLIVDSPRFVIGDFLINKTEITKNNTPEELYESIKFNKPDKKNNIIVRKDKSDKSKVIAKISENEKYKVIKREGDWIHIDVEAKKIKGWIKK